MTRVLKVFPSDAGLARGAAEHIVAVLRNARPPGEPASFFLSGGSTPRAVYELLASAEYRARIAWDHLHLFWTDERCVPPDSPESNYRMAREAFLASVPIPPRNVHRIHGELPPARAALAYEDEIRAAFGTEQGAVPRADLVLLGLGEDGHTASLFPGTPALAENERFVVDVYVERLRSSRVTVTFPLLNHARVALFLVSGAAKAAVLASVLRDRAAEHPAARVAPREGELLWYADRDAATHLSLSENV